MKIFILAFLLTLPFVFVAQAEKEDADLGVPCPLKGKTLTKEKNVDGYLLPKGTKIISCNIECGNIYQIEIPKNSIFHGLKFSNKAEIEIVSGESCIGKPHISQIIIQGDSNQEWSKKISVAGFYEDQDKFKVHYGEWEGEAVISGIKISPEVYPANVTLFRDGTIKSIVNHEQVTINEKKCPANSMIYFKNGKPSMCLCRDKKKVEDPECILPSDLETDRFKLHTGDKAIFNFMAEPIEIILNSMGALKRNSVEFNYKKKRYPFLVATEMNWPKGTTFSFYRPDDSPHILNYKAIINGQTEVNGFKFEAGTEFHFVDDVLSSITLKASHEFDGIEVSEILNSRAYSDGNALYAKIMSPISKESYEPFEACVKDRFALFKNGKKVFCCDYQNSYCDCDKKRIEKKIELYPGEIKK